MCSSDLLVSNRCGCASDLVREGTNGFTFDPANTEEIAEKMFRLSSAEAQLSTWGNASREIIANWSPEKFAKGMFQAVAVASSTSPSSATGFDRLFIWMMLQR